MAKNKKLQNIVITNFCRAVLRYMNIDVGRTALTWNVKPIKGTQYEVIVKDDNETINFLLNVDPEECWFKDNADNKYYIFDIQVSERVYPRYQYPTLPRTTIGSKTYSLKNEALLYLPKTLANKYNFPEGKHELTSKTIVTLINEVFKQEKLSHRYYQLINILKDID